MFSFVEHPTRSQPCPKCSLRSSGKWAVQFHENAHQDPMYDSWPKSPAPHLCWSCKTCGYVIQTETADVLVGAGVDHD